MLLEQHYFYHHQTTQPTQNNKKKKISKCNKEGHWATNILEYTPPLPMPEMPNITKYDYTLFWTNCLDT